MNIQQNLRIPSMVRVKLVFNSDVIVGLKTGTQL